MLYSYLSLISGWFSNNSFLCKSYSIARCSFILLPLSLHLLLRGSRFDISGYTPFCSQFRRFSSFYSYFFRTSIYSFLSIVNFFSLWTNFYHLQSILLCVRGVYVCVVHFRGDVRDQFKIILSLIFIPMNPYYLYLIFLLMNVLLSLTVNSTMCSCLCLCFAIVVTFVLSLR